MHFGSNFPAALSKCLKLLLNCPELILECCCVLLIVLDEDEMHVAMIENAITRSVAKKRREGNKRRTHVARLMSAAARVRVDVDNSSCPET